MDSVNVFLQQYKLVKKNINDISSILQNTNNILELDVTNAIKVVVEMFKVMMSIEKDELSEEQIKDINEKNDEIKKELIKLKNRQIYVYNLKVWEINDKIATIRKVSLDLKIDDKTKDLNLLKWCNIYLYRDWKRENYKNYLDYNKLQEIYNKLVEIEKDINLQNDEPLDIRMRMNFCNDVINDMKIQINNDLSIMDINTLLDKCLFVYDNIIELDILVRKYIDENILSDKLKGSYNYKLVGLSTKIKNIKEDLLLKKSRKEVNFNDFSLLKYRIEFLNSELKILETKVFNYERKSNKEILNRFLAYLKRLEKELSDIEDLRNSVKVDSNQSSQLDLNIEEIKKIFDKIKNVISNANIVYNSKRLFAVKSIKSANNLYKKYKIEYLKMSGLSSISLLGYYDIIPSIIYGNMIIGNKLSELNEFVYSLNTILGNIINARRLSDNNWYLSNEFIINPFVVGVSLLKNLSLFDINDDILVKDIKNLVKKMNLKTSYIIEKEKEFLNMKKGNMIEFMDNSIDVFNSNKFFSGKNEIFS